MTLFEVEGDGIRSVIPTSLVGDGIRERQDLQRWIRDCPDGLGEKLLIIDEEFGNWEDSRRRIDLLAMDIDGNLVVVELKRTEDGGFQDLQAIRYAAMISAMTFDDVVDAHDRYLRRRGIQQSGREAILEFLEAGQETTFEISSVPRIILVAQNFSIEITTTVLWLVERGLDLRCVQVTPYRVPDRLLLDFRQVLPLDQASEYQVRLRQKDEQVRKNSGLRRELTLHVLMRHNLVTMGTALEIVPDARPSDFPARDPKVFRATAGQLSRRESMIWEHDGAAYSLTRLTQRLAQEHGLQWLVNNIYVHWRICGDSKSMWDRAEELR